MPALSVLLIEDDEHDATRILDALRHAGYELVAERVATADGLSAGLARQTWELITCDDTLPGWSALAALALVRAHDSNVPIVVVSGQIGEEVAAALIRAGADNLVLKHNVQRLPKVVEQALRDATNRRQLPCALATDGTARRTTEEALRESEQRFRTLVEHAADAIYVHDAFGIITDVNPCACESLGYSRDELIGRPLTDIDQHLDADRVRHFLPQLLSGAPVLIETVHRRKDGTTFPVEIRSVRITRYGRPHVLGTCRDVTERKRAEEELRQARASLEIALTAAQAGVWDWDLQTGETHYAESWRTLFGYAPTEFDGSMEAWSRILHPDDLERLAGSTSAATAFVDPAADYAEEFRLRHKDGTYRWVFSRATVLRDAAAGTPQRMVGAHVDITSRWQMEEALRESEIRYRTLFESLDAAVLLMDGARCIDCNPATLRMFGLTNREEIIGKTPLAFSPPQQPDGTDSAESVRGVLETALAQGTRVFEWQAMRPTGETFLMEVHFTPFKIGAKQFFQSIAFDITERTRLYTELAALNRKLESRVAERTRQLTEAQERLNLVIDIASDGFWDWNVTTGDMYYSPRWIELLGYDLHAVPHHTSFGESLVHPEDMRRVQDALRDHFEGRTTIYECQNRLRMQSGRYRWNLSRGRVVERDADGRPLRMVGVDVDLSEKKALEEQLLHAQKMEAVGQLAGGVAHDFNNQLFVIRAYCDLLVKYAAAQPPLLESLEQIKHAVQRSAALTTQLLAFSRKQVLQPKILNLNAELFGIEKMLRRLIGDDIQLTLIPGADVGHVKVDPLQLQQIVMNLAINARDAMPHGGQLTLATKNAEVGATGAHSHFEPRPAPYVVLDVSDTGHGMHSETLSHVFEPFFTTKEPGKGTGLGLATVHGIVKQSGGQIAVDSEPGQGTTFTIYLPRIDAAVATVSRGATEPLADGSETVLLVEDEPAVREVVRHILAAQGYRVLLAANGKEGLELAERFDGPIHLLLTDVVMPQMNGPQLAERLQAVRPETAVIYMSGYAENAIAHHGVLAAGLTFLPKPCPTNLLVRTVRQRLDARQSKPGSR